MTDAGNTELRRIDLGGSPTECQFKRESWGMNRDRFAEFVRLMNHLSNSTPRKLTKEDIEKLKGICFRGTQLFLTLLPLYADNNFFLVQDNSVYSKGNEIEMRSFLVSRFSPGSTLDYANKYFYGNASFSRESFLGVEGKIFHRVLLDNGGTLTDVPDWLVQPVVLGFNRRPHDNPKIARLAEQVLDGTKPNTSTLEHIAGIVEVPLNKFRQSYPLISSTFTD